jgi:hypothetical protein
MFTVLNEMELSESLTCQCNGKVYKSGATLKAHRKSQAHLFWEQNKQQKDVLIKINQLENENGHLKRLNVILVERITVLEANTN